MKGAMEVDGALVLWWRLARCRPAYAITDRNVCVTTLSEGVAGLAEAEAAGD